MNIVIPDKIEVIMLKHYDNYNSKNLKTHKGYTADVIQFNIDNIIFICVNNLENNSLELIHYMEHSQEVDFGLFICKYEDDLYEELSEFVLTNQKQLIDKFEYNK